MANQRRSPPAKALTVLVLGILTVPTLVPPAAASWGMRGSVEPDTPYDLPTLMHQSPDWSTGPGKIFFAATGHFAHTGVNPNLGATQSQIYPTAFQGWYAYLGIWKDCNKDGYVGLAEAGVIEYRSEVLSATNPGQTHCPPEPEAQVYRRHNDGAWVRELIWIAPASSVGDRDLDGEIADDIALATTISWTMARNSSQAPTLVSRTRTAMG